MFSSKGPKLYRQSSRGSKTAQLMLFQAASASSGVIRRKFKKSRQAPWWPFLLKAYHNFGIKQAILLIVLIVYAFIGATIFTLIEAPLDLDLRQAFTDALEANRSGAIEKIIKGIFNNSNFLIFIDERQSFAIAAHLDRRLRLYENQVGVRYTEQRIGWTYWNAMLYSEFKLSPEKINQKPQSRSLVAIILGFLLTYHLVSIFTTIGYGHIHCRSNAGRVMTMIYAIVGIPLVLTVLNDMGKLLTIILKLPWFKCKQAVRRISRLCTNCPMEEILAVEKEERELLQVFDLPIPVAIGLVVAWIFLCSATATSLYCFCYVDAAETTNYNPKISFSLSTIGLGDIIPDKPTYLLIMFGYLIVGLSLVSMCINLIQRRLEKTYQVGRRGSIRNWDNSHRRNDTRRGMGILRASSSAPPFQPETVGVDFAVSSASTSTQTVLSCIPDLTSDAELDELINLVDPNENVKVSLRTFLTSLSPKKEETTTVSQMTTCAQLHKILEPDALPDAPLLGHSASTDLGNRFGWADSEEEGDEEAEEEKREQEEEEEEDVTLVGETSDAARQPLLVLRKTEDGLISQQPNAKGVTIAATPKTYYFIQDYANPNSRCSSTSPQPVYL